MASNPKPSRKNTTRANSREIRNESRPTTPALQAKSVKAQKKDGVAKPTPIKSSTVGKKLAKDIAKKSGPNFIKKKGK
jgi:hypothetical protein